MVERRKKHDDNQPAKLWYQTGDVVSRICTWSAGVANVVGFLVTTNGLEMLPPGSALLASTVNQWILCWPLRPSLYADSPRVPPEPLLAGRGPQVGVWEAKFLLRQPALVFIWCAASRGRIYCPLAPDGVPCAQK